MGKDIFSGGDEATVFADGLDASVETLRGAMAKRWGGRLDARPIDMRRIARGEATLPGEDVVVLALGEPTSYTGERRGRARITLPEAELENLRTLKRGGKKIVSVVFALPQDAFAIYDADLKRVVEPGEFTVFVGGDADTGNAVRLLHPGEP